MSVHGSKDVAFFLIGGYDVLGTVTEITDNGTEAILEETHTFGDAWREFTPVGLRTASMSQKGFFDDAAGSIHDALSTGPGVSRVLMYGMAGTATGADFMGWAGAMQVNYHRIIGREELHKAEAKYETNGPVEHGIVIRPYNPASSTGLSNVVDLGAATTGVAAYFAQNSTAGEANVRLMHSASAGAASYTAAFTFTKTASGVAAERQTSTGTLKRYVRADVTTASATGSVAALNYVIGLVRGLTS